MRELIRRLLMVGFLFGGLWMAVTPETELFQVEPVDWNQEMMRKKSRASGAVRTLTPLVGESLIRGLDPAPETRGAMADFIAHQTKGRLITVSGPAWEGFFNQLARTRMGQPPDAGWRSREAVDLCRGDLFFHTDEGPLADIRRHFNLGSSFNYIRINSPIRSAYIKANLTRTDGILRCAPGHLAYPNRHMGIGLLLAALAAYAAFRRRRPGVNSVIYSSARAGWGPDLMAVIGAGMFFVLPIFITSENRGGIFEPGWIILTMAFWLLGAIFASIWIISLKYMSFRIEYDTEGFSISQWGFIHRRYRYDEIKKVTADIVRTPKWLKRLLWLASLLDWRSAGQALLMEREDPALRIHTADERQYSLVITGLLGGGPFVHALSGAGVSVDAEVISWLPRQTNAGTTEAAARPSRIAGGVVTLILAALLGFFFMETQQPPEPGFAAGSFAEAPVFQHPDKKKRRVSADMIARQNQILNQMALENKRMKAVVKQAEKAATNEERKSLYKESQEILARIQALQAAFDRNRAEGQP